MTDYRFMLKKRSKKRNFSEREVAILTEEYKKHILILNSKLTNSITNQKKQRIWERITEAINAVGVNRRRVSEVKEKWRNMQRKARRIFAERKLSLATLEGPPPSNSGSNPRVRMVEKPLVDIEPLAGVTVAASTSSTTSMVDDNHSVAIGSENGSLQVNSNHRTDDKPSINNSHGNDSNGADVNDHLTIVIKEEIPDPVLKNDDLILSTVQSEPAEGDLADRTPLELVTPSIGCDTSPPSRNTVGNYGGFPSHNYNTKLVSTPEDNSSVYTTPQTQHWSSRLSQASSQVSSSKLHSLSGVSMASNNIRLPSSSLTSPRSYATNHGPSEKSNGIAVSSSLVLNNSIPDSLASLSSNSFVGRSHPLVTGGPSLSHLSQDNSVGPSVSHSKPSNRGTNTSGGITQADLLQLQYEVLLADKKRILTQTRYYEMKMKRIELELCGQANSFF